MFQCRSPYMIERPHVLVVACSDGRLQTAVDEFLDQGMGIRQFDRLFIPGGPAALAGAPHEPQRSNLARQEYTFLLRAHDIRQVIMMFHGPSEAGGPDFVVCADYARSMGTVDDAAIRRQQELDAILVMDLMADEFPHIQVQALWAEVTSAFTVRIVDHSAAMQELRSARLVEP